MEHEISNANREASERASKRAGGEAEVPPTENLLGTNIPPEDGPTGPGPHEPSRSPRERSKGYPDQTIATDRSRERQSDRQAVERMEGEGPVSSPDRRAT